jgi:hypothetical protein
MAVRFLAAAALIALTGQARAAGVVVLANRSEQTVTGTASTAEGAPRRVAVNRGDLTVLRVSGATTFSYSSANRVQAARLEEDSAYVLTGGADGLRLETLYAGGTPPGGPRKPAAEGALAPAPLATLPVKILVDAQEPARREVWEERLRKRLAVASEVLERQCRVRLEVVDVGTWNSSAEARNFEEQLADFERAVSPRPAALAIGFSGRRLSADRGGAKPAALPVPLRPHILIGEWFPLSEVQRLEVLLHELGHYLGAVHAKEAASVMRVGPGGGRFAAKDSVIGFDPLNVIVMNVVAREALREPPVHKLGALAAAARGRLVRLYKEAARLMPEDASPEKFLYLLEDVPPPRPARTPDPLVDGARAVVTAVTSAADAAAELRLSGDRLTEHCVRSGAAAASKLAEAQRAPALLLGLAVALDSSDRLRKAAPTRGLWERVETDDERSERLKVIGQPTMQGSHGLARHFVVAAALTATAGSKAAEPGGLVWELFEPEAGGAFSFGELAAELAGAAFARSLADHPDRLEAVAATFVVADYVPAEGGPEAGLTRDEFAGRFGSFADERFRQRAKDVRGLVAGLPAYRKR